MDEKKKVEEEVEEKEVKEEESNSGAPVSKEAVITDGDAKGKPEVYIDLEGKSGQEEFAKALVAEDAYDGTIVSVVIQEVKAWKSEGMAKKFLVSVLLDNQKDKDGNEVILPMFVNPMITKAYNKGVSNSKLYDILEKAGLLEEIGRMSGELEMLEALRAFLESRLQSRSVRVEVKTTNKNNPEKDSYSAVKSILRFVEVEEKKE